MSSVDSFFHMCLVVCPMLFLTGFVDSVAGGGGLISLPSYLFVGLPIHLAAGTNKVVNAIGTGTATWKYLRSGKVDLHTALWAAVGALAGGAIGARLALWCSEQVLQACVLAALPVAAAVMVWKRDLGQVGEDRWPPRQKAALSAVIGLCTGTYDGLLLCGEQDALGPLQIVDVELADCVVAIARFQQHIGSIYQHSSYLHI